MVAYDKGAIQIRLDGMGNWVSKFAQAGIGQVLGWLLRQAWTWAIASGAIGGTLAYLEDLPLLYIYLSTLSAAALVMAILGQNSLRRTLSSPKDKIVVEALNPFHWEDETWQSIRPQLIFKNLGNFPVEIDVKDISWSLDGMSGNAPVYSQTSALVPPLGHQTLRGPEFERKLPRDARGNPVGAIADIKINLQLRYGAPGHLRYLHRQNYIMRCWIDVDRDQTNVWLEQVGRGQFA